MLSWLHFESIVEMKQSVNFSWCSTSLSKSGSNQKCVYVFSDNCRIPSNWLSAFGDSFVFLTQTRQKVFWMIWRDYGSCSRSVWQQLMREERVFHIHRSHPGRVSWGVEPATSNSKTASLMVRDYILSIQKWGPYLFELGEIITTKSLSLLSG